MELRFHPAALAELRKSSDYYFVRSPSASQRFALAVETAVKAIKKEPTRFLRVGPNERSRRVDDFPFEVVYRQLDDVLYVVAISHTSRRPGYWKRRK